MLICVFIFDAFALRSSGVDLAQLSIWENKRHSNCVIYIVRIIKNKSDEISINNICTFCNVCLISGNRYIRVGSYSDYVLYFTEKWLSHQMSKFRVDMKKCIVFLLSIIGISVVACYKYG